MKTENIEIGRLPLSSFLYVHFLILLMTYIAVRQGEKLLLVQEKHISKQENFRLTSHLMYLLSCH